MKTVLSLALVVLSIIGLADASYLTYEKFVGVIPSCSPGFQCGTVLESNWASIGPVPLSAFGMAHYALILALAIALVLEFDIVKYLITVTTKTTLLILTTWGFLFSMVLVGIMGLVLKAWCPFCLVSAATSSLLFISMLGIHFSSSDHDQTLE